MTDDCLPHEAGRVKSSDDPLRVIASTALSSTIEIVGRKDWGIEKPLDLKGKRVGVTLGTAGEYFLMTFLLMHRMSVQEISPENLSPQNMAEALESMEDAARWKIKTAGLNKEPPNYLDFG